MFRHCRNGKDDKKNYYFLQTILIQSTSTWEGLCYFNWNCEYHWYQQPQLSVKLCSTFLFPLKPICLILTGGSTNRTFLLPIKKPPSCTKALVLQTEPVSWNQCPHSITGFKDKYLCKRQSCADAAGEQRLWSAVSQAFEDSERLNESVLHSDSNPYLWSNSSSQHFDPEHHQPLCFTRAYWKPQLSWAALSSTTISCSSLRWILGTDDVTEWHKIFPVQTSCYVTTLKMSCSIVMGTTRYPLNSNTGRGEPFFYPSITTPTVLGTSQKHTHSSRPISALQKPTEGQRNCHFKLLSTSCNTAGKATGNR